MVGRVEGRDPELTLYLTAWPPESATPEAIASALAPYGTPSFVAYDGMYPYSQTPPLEPVGSPDRKAADAAALTSALPRSAPPRTGRGLRRLGDARVFGGTSGVFLRPVDDALAAARALLAAYQWCPSRMCGIDFQHAGGAVGDVAPSEMAYGQRAWEWSTVFHGNWLEGTSDGSLEAAWIRRAARAADSVPGFMAGFYAVDIGNNAPDEGAEDLYAEASRAYGESEGVAHVDLLCHLKRDVDPNNVLGEYFPLCPPSTSPLTVWRDGVIASLFL
uniref:Berberine/berberine-like domain-containing protein n=1 Tax=Tetraselmis chuii TaxID=63592 RepID=A0A6U1JXW1_9CHLO